MNWSPVSEYRAEMGRVIVWLQWAQYSRAASNMESTGTWVAAYILPLNSGSVWVDFKDCMPIETTGRRVTHFMNPGEPAGAESKKEPTV